jgi:hypothetical protein
MPTDDQLERNMASSALQVTKTSHEEARCRHEHQRHRNLTHEQRISNSLSGGPPHTSATHRQSLMQIGARSLQGRNQPKKSPVTNDTTTTRLTDDTI